MEGREEKLRGQNGFVKDTLALPDPALTHNLSLDGGNEVAAARTGTCLEHADAALLPWSHAMLVQSQGVCFRWGSTSHHPHHTSITVRSSRGN